LALKIKGKTLSCRISYHQIIKHWEPLNTHAYSCSSNFDIQKNCSPSPCTPRALWIFQFGQESRKICNPKVRDFFSIKKNPSKHNKYWWTNNLHLVHKQFSWNIEQNVTFDRHRWMQNKIIIIIFCAKRFVSHQRLKSKVE